VFLQSKDQGQEDEIPSPDVGEKPGQYGGVSPDDLDSGKIERITDDWRDRQERDDEPDE